MLRELRAEDADAVAALIVGANLVDIGVQQEDGAVVWYVSWTGRAPIRTGLRPMLSDTSKSIFGP